MLEGDWGTWGKSWGEEGDGGKDRELLHVGGQAREDVVRGGGGVGRVPTEVGIGHESSQGSTE